VSKDDQTYQGRYPCVRLSFLIGVSAKAIIYGRWAKAIFSCQISTPKKIWDPKSSLHPNFFFVRAITKKSSNLNSLLDSEKASNQTARLKQNKIKRINPNKAHLKTSNSEKDSNQKWQTPTKPLTKVPNSKPTTIANTNYAYMPSLKKILNYNNISNQKWQTPTKPLTKVPNSKPTTIANTNNALIKNMYTRLQNALLN
jgi:hypothetical protein